MKRFLFSSSIALILSCITIVVSCQDIKLSQSVKSGIYMKDQRISVTAFAENLSGDTLHIQVLKNNNQLINQKTVIIGKDSLIVYEGSFKESCSIIVEAKAAAETASLGMLVDPGALKPGARRPGRVR